MAKVKSSPFRLNQVTVQRFSIERNPNKQGKFNIKIHPSGFVNKADHTFLLVLDIQLFDSEDSYKIDMNVFGHFEFKEIDDEDSLNSFFYTNAPALVFPYIRSYVSAVSALSGLESIQLPVMNLSSLKNELKNNITDITNDQQLLN